MSLPALAPMTLADLDAVMEIERASFPQPWTRHMYFMDLTQNDLATYLVLRPALDAPANVPPVLAYGGSWLMVDETHIATLAAHPDYRGCGMAALVLLGLMDLAAARGGKRSTLEVRVSNLSAQHLYARLGFEIVAQRRRYYQDGEDAFIMTTPRLNDPALQAQLVEARAAAEERMRTCLAASSATEPR